jgi:hypothetical protein
MNMAMCNSLAQRRDERSQLRAVPRRIIVQFEQRDGCGGEDDAVKRRQTFQPSKA